jgi:hypothetical protein
MRGIVVTQSQVPQQAVRGDELLAGAELDIADVDDDPRAIEHAPQRQDNATGADGPQDVTGVPDSGTGELGPLVGDEIDIADVDEDPQAAEHALQRRDNATGTDG